MRRKIFTQKVFIKTLTTLLFFMPFLSRGQALTGVKTIGTTYPTIADAITALNANGVGAGGVIFNVPASYIETAPLGGFRVTATGTAANPIVFQKSGVGANPLISAYIGVDSLLPTTIHMDGIWSFIGSDYVTVDGIDIIDPNIATPGATSYSVNMMEYGYGFFKNSVSDGCQYNSIKNCSVSLNSMNGMVGPTYGGNGYTGVTGIAFFPCKDTATASVLTPTSALGTNSYNKIYSNTIQNCFTPIAMYGYPTTATALSLGDVGNDIGGSSIATGNTILSFGNGVSTLFAASTAYAAGTIFVTSTGLVYTVSAAGTSGAAAPTSTTKNTAITNGSCTLYYMYTLTVPMGIAVNHQWNVNISYNTVANGILAPQLTALRGIYLGAAVSASATINSNTIYLKTAATSANIEGIENNSGTTAAGNTINMNSNTITLVQGLAPNTTTGILGVQPTGSFYGIYNLGSPANLNIINNTFVNDTSYSTTGSIYEIYNTAAVLSSINMNNNEVGKIVFPGATGYSGTLYNIANAGGTTGTALSISNNNFSGYTFTNVSSGTIYYISQTNNNFSLNINNNYWTNITVNNSGSQYFISNASNTQAIHNINDNAIVTGYTRSASAGPMYILYATSSSLPNCIYTISGNNFSNITATTSGTGLAYLLYNADGATGPYPKKTISNNTFSNITYNGTGVMYGVNCNYLGEANGVGSSIYNNIISDITTAASTFYGIYPNTTTSPNYAPNVYGNTVTGITCSGATTTVYGLYLGAGVSGLTCKQNKIGNINATGASALVYGVYTLSSAPYTISNNVIGDLRTPASTNSVAVNGIYISSGTTVNLFYNTINLSGTSTGSGFGTNGVFASTTPTLNMSNNIIVNNCTPTGSGKSIAFKRGTTALGTYTLSSNNNLFYAGATPSSTKAIFFDGTKIDSTLAQFKASVSPREGASVTENVSFIGTGGSLPNFLQPDSITITKIESAAKNIAGYNVDINGVVRAGNVGYTGSSVSPDMGAYEGNLTGIAMVFDSCNTDQMTTVALVGASNQAVLRMRVYTEDSYTALTATKFKLNTAGTTNISDISNARVYCTGSSPVFSTANQYGTAVAAPNGTFYITGNQTLLNGATYFWLTYDIAASASTSAFVDARWDSVMLSGVNQAPIDGNPAGATQIASPLAGTYTIGSAPYFSVAEIVNDLTTRGILSSVTVNVPAGHIEQAPSGGYLLGSVLLNSNLSASRTLKFVKSGSGLNPVLYANTGKSTTIDGVFMLLGCDYVTIDGIDLTDTNLVSPTTQMEQGYGLVKLNSIAPFDGCQHDTIMNCVVKLKRTNTNSRGIYVNNAAYGDALLAALPVADVADANSYNVILNNTVENSSWGIMLGGFNAVNNNSLYDQGNVVNNNSIINFSGYGVWMVNQSNHTVSFNTIDNYNGGNGGAVAGTGSLYGIYTSFTNTSSVNPSNITANNNFITLTQGSASSGASYNMYINYSHGNTTINNNRLKLASTGASAGTGSLYGLYFYPNNVQIPGTFQQIKNNHIDSCVVNNSSGTIYQFYSYGSTFNADYSGNTVTYFSRNGTTSGSMYPFYAYYNGNYSVVGTVSNIYNNIVDSVSNGVGSGNTFNGYYIGGGHTTNFYNNSITRIYAAGTGGSLTYGIYPYYSTVMNVYNNTVSTISGGATVYGIYIYGALFQTANVYGNTFDNLTSIASGNVFGIYDYTGGTVALNIFKNKIHSVSVPSGAGTATGIFIGGSSSGAPTNMPILVHNNSIGNINAVGSTANPGVIGLRFDYINAYNYSAAAYYNTISLTGALGTNGSSAGVYVSNLTPTIKLANNIIINNTTVSGTGYASAIQRNGITTTSYDITSNNNLLYAGAPSASHLIYNDGANRDQTIAAYKTRIAPRESSSFTENLVFINASNPLLPYYLQPDTTLGTGIESGAVTVGDITTDLNGKIRQGNAGYSGTGTATDIGAIEANYTQADFVAPIITLTQPGNTASTLDRVVTATITDNTGVPVLALSPVLYYKKFAAGSYIPSVGTRTGGTAKNGIWSFTILASNMGALALGDSVYYYIVAQDSSVNTNLGSYPTGAIGTDVNNITTNPAAFAYKIVPGLAGVVTVGTAGTYTSLTNAGGAFEAINSAELSGNVTLEITSDLSETGSVALNKWSETGSGNYTVRIVPGSAGEKVITNSTASNSSVIIFNGATRVTVDGRFGGSGRNLRFRNRVTSGVVFILRNDAVRDTIMYTNMECVNNTTGTVWFAGSNVVGGRGNDSNVVMYNNISDTLNAVAPAGAPNTGISSSGTAGLENDANTISFNNIYNWGYNAVNLNAAGTGNNWTIYGNNIYQTANRTTGPFYIIYVQGGGGHIIRKNSIGGAAADRSGIPIFTTNTIYGYYQTGTSTLENIIDSNTIANINSASPVHGINITNGAALISNNIIGGLQNPRDSIFGGNTVYGIYTSGNKNITVNGNTISNLRYTGGSTVAISGMYINSSGAVNNVTNNNVHDIIGNGAGVPSNYYHAGITLYNGNSGGPVVCDNNTIYNIVNTNFGAATGLNNNYSASPVSITRNKIYNVSSLGGVVNGIYGPYSNGASFVCANNQISLSASNGTGVVVGITDAAQNAGTSTRYFNNTVFVGGIAGSSAIGNSYAFYRNGAGMDMMDVRNNIFYNKRTGGAGANFAIGYTSANNMLPSTINYNLMVVTDTATLVELPASVLMGVAAYNASYTNSPNANWMALTSAVPAQTLFTDTAVGNLSIVTTNANSWYANGKGIAIAEVTNDFNGAIRSTTIAGGATDIGAFEFTTSTTPPSATASAAPAVGTTTNYTFAGRKIASITWGAAGTVPTSVAVQYYTGTTAPSLLASKTQFNSYYSVTPTGGTGYTYSMSLSYDSAMFGNVSSSASAKLARYQSPNWNLYATSTANGFSGVLSSGTSNAATTLPANFTGTDNSNPLPVSILSISASKVKEDVLVNWSTASESNVSVFEIERAFDGNKFEFVGTVNATGNSSKVVAYRFNDMGALAQATSGSIYYRLKMIDNDGSFEYSKAVSVTLSKEDNLAAVTVYPNPFEDQFTIQLPSSVNGNAVVRIIDIAGKVLSTSSHAVKAGMNLIQVEESNLKAGMYFLSIELNGQKQTLKLNKQ